MAADDDDDEQKKQEPSSSPPAKKAAKLAHHDSDELPAGWTAHVDPATKATYYWNASMSATSWERPRVSSASAAAGKRGALWVKHSDPESGVPYFCNTATNETQWEVPAEDFVDATVFAPSVSTVAPNAGGERDYVATASFNAVNGQFGHADGKTYWDAVGKSNDRDTRMMSLYFDVSTLEKNREQAEEKKRKLRKYDWRKYKEIKKKEKTKRRVQELLKD